MKAVTLKLNNLNTKKIFISLVLAVFFLSSFYIYLILQTTINITTYQNIKEEIVEMNSLLGRQEFEYMSLKKDINLEMAQILGFIEASNINFVDKENLGKKLSLID